ncbi:MAG: right-handed parallel beta-helix repeat-containing protein [Candidatus Amulumruptor caecigallinarius]|nr:right-handed parallel beta-helix repeat-containing protein [Candidatus Amulumruptor caecigallinarius]MCM1397064.1 right-handed parallel beta-helix repeat-containing protein [Candidatus Amulumruptor caecigallinarius]MCM1454012.1 right-handed parallel beta-helix repeat-containing protein [bacterium]
MKKYILTSAALATMLFTACSSEEPVSVGSSDGSGNVCFTAELPGGIMSRAYSDGLTATNLTYALYDEEGTHLPNLDGTATVAGLKASVSLNLVTGKSYTIVFWSEAPGNSHYTFDKDAGTVTVAATGASQDESRDAFFANYSFTVTGAINETIVLKRPFAQINIGTSDLKAFTDAGGSITESGLTVKGYNTLNLLTGKVQGEMVEYTFANAPHATAEKFPASTADKTYDYLVMDYILMGTDKEVVDLTWTSDNAGAPAVSFTGVPVQRNYRTNIYGALLTNPAKFNVEIVPDYGGGADVTPWDGTASEITPDEEGNYTISSASELAAFAKMVNELNTFEGKTVTLASDIDLAGKPWTPAGDVNAFPSKTFKGTFDGANHTISGLNAADFTAKEGTAGLFGSIKGTVKNVTIANATILSHHYAGAITGYTGDGAVIENCHVKNSTVTSESEVIGGSYDNGDKVGAIAGISTNGAVSIKGCSVENVTVKGYRNLGGIVGYGPTATVADCRLSNVKIVQDLAPGYKDYAAIQNTLGVIDGRDTDNLGNNTAEGVTFEVLVNSAVSLLDLTKAAKTATYTLNVKPEKVQLGEFAEMVTVYVPAGVEFPSFTNSGKIANFTLKGEPTSAKASPVFNLPAKAENLVFDGVHFTGQGIYHYGGEISNVTVKDCNFTELIQAAVSIQKADNGTPFGNINVENCTIEFGPDAPTSANGIYLMNVDNVTVKGCTIKNGKAHGMNIRPTNSVTVENNNLSNISRDGIKLECYLGVKNATVSRNNVQCGENGIRVKSPSGLETLNIIGNTIDSSKFVAYNETEGEPWCIYVYNADKAQTTEPVANITGNTENGNCGHFINVAITTAASSNIQN